MINGFLGQTLEDRLLRYTVKTRTCWIFKGVLNKDGYGQFNLRRGGKWTTTTAHRIAYQIYRDSIKPNLEIDHLCRNRACVNPEHLELVTRLENMNRAKSFRRPITHCRRGHVFDKINTYCYRGHRACKTCRQANLKRSRAKRKGLLLK